MLIKIKIHPPNTLQKASCKCKDIHISVSIFCRLESPKGDAEMEFGVQGIFWGSVPVGGRHGKRGPTGMLAWQSLGQCHRGLLSGHSLSGVSCARWNGQHFVPRLWRSLNVATREMCSWVRQQNPEAGDNLEAVCKQLGHQVLIWMGIWVVHLPITAKIMALLLTIGGNENNKLNVYQWRTG